MLTSKCILFSFYVLSTICVAQEPVKQDYDINLHVINRKKLIDLLYNTPVRTVSASTRISRLGTQFHSIVDNAKKRETYAIDHCHDPGKKSATSTLTIIVRSHLKTPCHQCKGTRFWGLRQTTDALLSGPIYFRLSQHSDQNKMVDSDTGHFKFQWDFKCGDPVHTTKLKQGTSFPTSSNAKSLASRINRWLHRASKQKYLELKRTFKKIEADGQYQDFLLGTHCGIGIIEVLVANPGEKALHPGLIFYNHQLNDVLLTEVLPQETEPSVQQAEACPDFTPAPEHIEEETPLPSYHSQDPLQEQLPTLGVSHGHHVQFPDAAANITNSTLLFLMPVAATLQQLNLNNDDGNDDDPYNPCPSGTALSF